MFKQCQYRYALKIKLKNHFLEKVGHKALTSRKILTRPWHPVPMGKEVISKSIYLMGGRWSTCLKITFHLAYSLEGRPSYCNHTPANVNCFLLNSDKYWSAFLAHPTDWTGRRVCCLKRRIELTLKPLRMRLLLLTQVFSRSSVTV